MPLIFHWLYPSTWDWLRCREEMSMEESTSSSVWGSKSFFGSVIGCWPETLEVEMSSIRVKVELFWRWCVIILFYLQHSLTIPVWERLSGRRIDWWIWSEKKIQLKVKSCKTFQISYDDIKSVLPVRLSSSICFNAIWPSQDLILHSISSFSACSMRSFWAWGFWQ